MAPTIVLVNRPAEAAYFRGLGRAVGGAILFNIPLLMTMEMWTLGTSMSRWRLLVFCAAAVPLLVGLASFAGFSPRRGLLNDLLDTFAALAVGLVTGLALLGLLGIVDQSTSFSDGVGQVLLQAIPGAMGALLARRQLSSTGVQPEKAPESATYSGELFLMAAGALFLALNLAPTEEMVLIGYMASPYHTLLTILATLTLLHVIVYKAGFGGQEEQGHPVTAFFHFTLPGYVIALTLSVFVLWCFGRTDGHDIAGITSTAVVLGFPAALGAAAARLLV